MLWSAFVLVLCSSLLTCCSSWTRALTRSSGDSGATVCRCRSCGNRAGVPAPVACAVAVSGRTMMLVLLNSQSDTRCKLLTLGRSMPRVAVTMAQLATLCKKKWPRNLSDVLCLCKAAHH